MRWMITEDRLGPEQRDVIDEIAQVNNRPVWIQGHAGSGKSVLLLHALADYITANPGNRVCVVVFTRALVDLLTTGLTQIPRLNGVNISVFTIYQLRDQIDNGHPRYNAIFCDEVQDLPLEFINSMKTFCDKLILAGDAEQSIYSSVPVWNASPASFNEIKTVILPMEKKLGVIYRLTQSVLNVLKRVFPSMLEDMPNIARQDTEIALFEFTGTESKNEIEFCWQEIKLTTQNRVNEVSAVLLWSQDAILTFVNKILSLEGIEPWIRVNDGFGRPNYNILNFYLNSKGIPLMYVGNGYGSLTQAAQRNKVIIMTYHSAKGLDFDYVFLPMVNTEMAIANERPLLLVALSRSKAGLFISYTGNLYAGLKPFLSEVPVKSIVNNNTNGDIVLPF